MPLEPGKSKKVIGHNVGVERHAGKPEKQSIAIAFSKAGKSKKEDVELEAIAPSMNSVFEGKKKAKDGPGCPAEVGSVPTATMGNPLDDFETKHDEKCLDDIYKMGMGEGLRRMFPGLVFEAINPGQLHDPKDFVQKLRELSAETSSTCAMLEQFVESHKGDPEWKNIQANYLSNTLGEMSKAAERLAKWVGPVEKALTKQEQQEDAAAQNGSGGGYGGGALFKK